MTAALAALAGILAAAGITDLATSRRTGPAGPLAVLIALGRRFAPARMAVPDDLAGRLERAGDPLPLADAWALKTGGALAGALLGVLLAVPAVPLGATAGFLALDAWLAARARARADAMAIELPDVLDLLRVTLAAGLPPTRAIGEVGARHTGVLAQELARAAAQIQVGVPRAEALERLRRRAPLTAALATVLERADRLGAPPAEALAALARDARETRARTRAEQAAKAAPKIQLVVALLLVPSVMLLVAAALVPALLTTV